MKRSFSSLYSHSSKRNKTNDDSTTGNIDQSSLVLNSINYFLDQSKNAFINYLRMPPILFKHQLYSYKINNRTRIDCELQTMFNNNQIRLFHSDYGVMFMLIDDYHLLVERQLYESGLSSLSIEKNRLKQRFIQDLLPKAIRLSMDRKILEDDFQFSSNDINLLVQSGLLLPKQINEYWFSIPNLSSFILCLEKARRSLLQMLSRRTYGEIPFNEFRLRDTKNKCLLGFIYHIYDVIGGNLAHIIDAPTGPIVKRGSEKI